MNRLRISILLPTLAWLALFQNLNAQTSEAESLTMLAADNIVWDKPSTNSTESMPLSGGLLGLNAWVEQGELRLLIANADSQDELGFQVKLGLLAVKLGDGKVLEKDFRQELRLATSDIVISSRKETGEAVEIKVWCVANKPIFHVQVNSEAPLNAEVRYESWAGHETKFVDDKLQWMRRNAKDNKFRQDTISRQQMKKFATLVPDPLSNLTVGGIVSARDMVAAGTGKSTFNGMPTATATLKSRTPTKQLDLIVTLRMEQDSSESSWQNALRKAAIVAEMSTEKDRAETTAWWTQFWGRSHIQINPKMAGSEDRGWLLGRNYRLGRYQLAANVSGRMPSLFNGGSFVCDNNPDQRKWDYCYYIAQNMRLLYWPLLKSGDFDMMEQPFSYYRERVPLQKAFAKKWWGVKDGLVFPEVIDPFGMDPLGITAEGRSNADHLRYHYTGCMEFAWMMLQHAAFTGEDIRPNLPFIEGIVHYYDDFYQRQHAKNGSKKLDENGHLVIFPSDALEVINAGTNTVTDITGLTAIARGLLDLPQGILNSTQVSFFRGFLARIPPLTIKEIAGKKTVAAAQKDVNVFYSENMEFPEMYVCFPFDYYFMGRKGDDGEAGIELVKNTWDFGGIRPTVQKQALCWYQSAINLARMGRAKEAMDFNLRKMVTNPTLRFPTFYSAPGFCCVGPDTDHIGAGMIGVQEMLMQTDGKRILIAPAWPSHWDCDFKLHAPFQTVVEGRIVDGKVTIDKVTPESRRKDIQMYDPADVDAPLSEGKKVTVSGFWGHPHEAEKLVDGNQQSRWAATLGSTSSWFEVDLGAPMMVGRAVINEVSYHFVRKYALQAQMGDGSWKTLAEGSTIGSNKEHVFTPVKAQKFRLQILESTTHASIEEFQLFSK